MRSHSKAPYLRLVVDQDHPNLSAFGTGDLLEKLFDFVGGLRAANNDELSRVGL